jgi:hypothetical protein
MKNARNIFSAKLLIIIATISFLFGCSDKPDDEVVIDKYPNGNLKAVVKFKQGEQHGVSKYFRENGNLHMVAHYKHGKIHGLQSSFYPNGNISATTNYRHGRVTGIETHFFEEDSGIVKSTEHIVVVEGKERPQMRTEFDRDGNVVMESSKLIISMNDTVANNQDTDITFEFTKPEYTSILVVLGNFDSLFVSSTENNTKTFTGTGNKLKVTIKPSGKGIQYLRGYAMDFKIVPESTTSGRSISNNIFFEKAFFIKE